MTTTQPDIEALDDLEEVQTTEERWNAKPRPEPRRQLKAFELELAMWVIEGKLPAHQLQEFMLKMELRQPLPEDNRPADIGFTNAVIAMAFHGFALRIPSMIPDYPLRFLHDAERRLAILIGWFTPTEQAVIACEINRRFDVS